MSEFATKPIHELAPLLERREVSPVDVTREALDRISALDGQLHTFISLWPEQALADARAAEAQIAGGDYRGPLHGVPLGIKDNIALAGRPTTNGSSLMTDHVTDYDATVVENLRAAGAVLVGKNNMHEWAMGSGTNPNAPFGATQNPWKLGHIPGGSSGGSAAAVSCSLIYGSVGTDGMGSVRMPAAYCGVVGLKPTYGLVSRFGELPPTSSTSDHLGPIAKDVRDAALLLGLLAGHDSRDPTSLPSAPKDYTAALGQGVAGLRIGLPREYFFELAEPEVREAVMKAVGVLASLGAEAMEVSIPSLEHMALVGPATANESRAYLLQFALQGPQTFADQSIWERLITSQLVRQEDAHKATRLRNLMRQQFLASMEIVDVLAVPTIVCPAFPIDLTAGVPPRFGDSVSLTTALTYPFNVVGMPAISVPCGFGAEGLPIGLTLAGRHWEDDLVLRVAYAYEQAATHGYQAPVMAR